MCFSNILQMYFQQTFYVLEISYISVYVENCLYFQKGDIFVSETEIRTKESIFKREHHELAAFIKLNFSYYLNAKDSLTDY